MNNKDTIQASYHVEEPIEILSNHIKTLQAFFISVNSILYNQKVVDMGITKILSTQEYTHEYGMWKSILANERTWVYFKTNF